MGIRTLHKTSQAYFSLKLTNLKKLYTLVGIAMLFSVSSHAQVIRSFTPRFTTDTKGRMVFVSNNIITTKQKSGGNAPVYMQAPPSCPASSFLCKNDGENNTNIDIDGDPTTFNSSSASITLPDCSGVAYAALYWSAGIAASQAPNPALPMSNGGWNEIKFKTPGGSYQTVIADRTDTINSVFHGYQSFADVTGLVRKGGSGYYTVANVKCDTVNPSNQPIVNAFGGWTMVVIYRDSTQPLRNMTIFDGLAVVRNSGTDNVRTITVSGFKCPPTGDVAAKLGMVVYDGDRDAADGLEVRRNSDNTFKAQTDAGESADIFTNAGDAWNSSITDTTSLVSTRIPAHENTYGYDAHIFKLNNATKQYLRNDDNTAVFRMRTSSEGYVLGVVTSEIDTYEPEMLMENTITNLNGPTVEKGDTLLVDSRIRNTGTDLALQVHADNKLEPYFKYVPNSIVINGVAKSDSEGDDEASYDPVTQKVSGYVGAGSSASAGGTVSANNTANYSLSYKVTISESCADIGITPTPLLLQSKIFYQGQASGTADSVASRPMVLNNCVQPIAPDTLQLLSGCGSTLPVRLLGFSGSRSGNGILLKWSVEEHNDGKNYLLQSSVNGTDFTAVYSRDVPLQEGVFNYEHLDITSYNSNAIYYRLVMKSVDGTIEYSRTISIRKDSNVQLDLSPNPVVSGTVTFRSSAIINRLEWYNTNGQLVKTLVNPVNGQTIQLGELGTGIYLVKAYKEGETVTIKMIKK